ncbi:MAG: hypothetical protein SGCHY_004809, partial [Lobulomycetales sp.]
MHSNFALIVLMALAVPALGRPLKKNGPGFPPSDIKVAPVGVQNYGTEYLATTSAVQSSSTEVVQSTSTEVQSTSTEVQSSSTAVQSTSTEGSSITLQTSDSSTTVQSSSTIYVPVPAETSTVIVDSASYEPSSASTSVTAPSSTTVADYKVTATGSTAPTQTAQPTQTPYYGGGYESTAPTQSAQPTQTPYYGHGVATETGNKKPKNKCKPKTAYGAKPTVAPAISKMVLDLATQVAGELEHLRGSVDFPALLAAFTDLSESFDENAFFNGLRQYDASMTKEQLKSVLAGAKVSATD